MDIKILFGSETGNSEEIAKRIANDLLSLKITTLPATLNAFTNEVDKLRLNQNKKILIVICSTTGNGDPPKSSEKFIRLIRNKNLDANYLLGFEFALLGLGDSNYSKFQAIPKLIDSNLLRLGAKPFVPKGQADDAYGLEETVEPWVEALIDKIKSEKENLALRVKDQSTKATVELEVSNLSLNLQVFKSSDYSAFNKTANYQVEHNVRISGPLAVKEVYHLKINKIQESSNSSENDTIYEPGSHICLLPELEQAKVDKLLEIVKITSDEPESESGLIKLPIDVTEKTPHLAAQYMKNKGFFSKEDLFKYVLDFSTPMKKVNLIKFFEIVEETLKEEKPKSLILSLKKALINDFSNFNKYKMSFFDLLVKIKSKDISFTLNVHTNHLLVLFNIKQPRRYSLSTSYTHDYHMGIYYSVVDERIYRKGLNEILTSESARYLGEATNFMKGMTKNSRLLVTSIENFFPFNKEIHIKHAKPLIYVSNGTGISPVVSYLKHISRENKEKFGSLYVVTGFRSNSKDANDTIEEDFISKFISEVNASSSSLMFSAPLSNKKAEYLSCYSNDDQNDDEECGYWRNMRINYDYVQDIVNDKKELFYKLLIEDEGIMMICGDVEKIYAEVMETFIGQIKAKRLIEREEAVYLLEKLKSQGRIMLEKWH